MDDPEIRHFEPAGAVVDGPNAATTPEAALFEALLQGVSPSAIAKEAGVSTFQLVSLLGRPGVREAVRPVIRGVDLMVALQIEGLKLRAIETLSRQLGAGERPMTADHARSADLARRTCVSILRLSAEGGSSKRNRTDEDGFRLGGDRGGDRLAEPRAYGLGIGEKRKASPPRNATAHADADASSIPTPAATSTASSRECAGDSPARNSTGTSRFPDVRRSTSASREGHGSRPRNTTVTTRLEPDRSRVMPAVVSPRVSNHEVDASVDTADRPP